MVGSYLSFMNITKHIQKEPIISGLITVTEIHAHSRVRKCENMLTFDILVFNINCV